MVVYIAGPFRSTSEPYDCWEQEQNIRRAEALALDVWRAGLVAICPHAMTRHYQGALPDRAWLEGDLEILGRCDAVLLTPDWSASRGAVKERDRALELGIPVYESLSDLVEAAA